MSDRDDTEILHDVISSGEARQRELETLARASRLMREAADLLLALPATDPTRAAAARLAEACLVLAGPKAG